MDFSRVVLRIDLKRLAENFKVLRKRAGSCRLLAVVKADAYGLGAEPVARTLKAAGADEFGVATLAEARTVCGLGLPVQILGALFDEELEEAVALDLNCPCPDFETARKLSEAAKRRGVTVRGVVKIDSGMGRLGLPIAEALPEIRRMNQLPNLELHGIYSHFPQAAKPGNAFTVRQIAAFCTLVSSLAAEGIRFRDVHIAASDGINFYPEALREPFTLARAGLSMYGVPDDPELPSIVSLYARLGAVRRLRAGATVGYHSTCVLERDTLEGTVAAGYADGLPLALSNRGAVVIHGRRCPVLGRISMDYTTVSLENAPEAKPGDEVELFGPDLPPGEWAELKGTHLHDILCAVSPRVKREYVH